MQEKASELGRIIKFSRKITGYLWILEKIPCGLTDMETGTAVKSAVGYIPRSSSFPNYVTRRKKIMAKGENIYKRKDGRWEARYARDYDITGRIRYGYCYGKTYKEAKEKVTKAKAALLIGKPVSTARVTNRFAFFCDTWLQSRKGKVKESTCVKYAAILEKHIKPSLGGCYPLAITESQINTFSDKLLFERELSPKTVKDILVILRSILNFTAKNVPGTFPRIDIVYPKEEKKEMRVLTRDEQTVFINYLLTNMDECRFGVLLALLTGIRIGELCALRWGNISLKDKTIK